MPDPVFGERVCVFVELKAARRSRPARRSSNTFCSRAFPRSCCPSGSRSSTSCRGPRAARSPKANFAKTFDRHWSRVMTTEEVRRGGLEVWAPSKVPPIGVDLTDEQQMAIAFRHLADIGFAENMAGHITWQPDGQTDMYVNPWGLWWQELTASDICVVDEDARVVRGRWDVTPAIHLHTELHRLRPDATGGDPQPPVLRQPDRRARHAARAGPPDRLAVPRRHVSRREVRRRDRCTLARSRTGRADRFGATW